MWRWHHQMEIVWSFWNSVTPCWACTTIYQTVPQYDEFYSLNQESMFGYGSYFHMFADVVNLRSSRGLEGAGDEANIVISWAIQEGYWETVWYIVLGLPAIWILSTRQDIIVTDILTGGILMSQDKSRGWVGWPLMYACAQDFWPQFVPKNLYQCYHS